MAGPRSKGQDRIRPDTASALSPRRPALTSVEDILALTRKALDEFGSMPLAANLRRAERIARLRRDIQGPAWFGRVPGGAGPG